MRSCLKVGPHEQISSLQNCSVTTMSWRTLYHTLNPIIECYCVNLVQQIPLILRGSSSAGELTHPAKFIFGLLIYCRRMDH